MPRNTFFVVPCLFVIASLFAGHEASAAKTKTVAAPVAVAYKANSFPPLFTMRPTPPSRLAMDFVGRDPSIVEMDFSTKASGVRASQIRQMESDFKLQKAGSPTAQQIGETLLKLYEEQATYLENLRGFQMKDPKYADLNHHIKALRSSVVNQADMLIRQFPRHEKMNKWQSASLISRIKIGDPSSAKAAYDFMQAAKGSSDAGRMKVVGLLTDYANGKTNSAYGTLSSSMDSPMDAASRAALKLLIADGIDWQKNADSAREMYLAAAKEGMVIRALDGAPGPVTQRAVNKLVEISFGKNPTEVDMELVDDLKSLNMFEPARAYVERIAIKNIPSQHKRAMTNYADVLSIADLPLAQIMAVELRTLDISLSHADVISNEMQWERLAKYSNAFNLAGDARITATQKQNWALADKSPSNDSVERFIRMHDIFFQNFKQYALEETWSVKTVEGLFKIQRYADAAKRGDFVADTAKQTGTQIATRRLSARSREKLLGIGDRPVWVKGKKLSSGADVSVAYVRTLDKLAPLVTGLESEKSVFQAGYVSDLMGDMGASRTRIEAGLNKYPQSTFSGGAVSYVLDTAIKSREYLFVERFARLAESKKILPANKAHKNLRGIIEVAVYEQANQFAAEKKYDLAAAKYLAFQKEFPKSSNAARSLDLASRNFHSYNNLEGSVKALEVLLAQYINSPFALDARWRAAEQSKALNQHLRAANHYESFARGYKQEAIKRQAWFKAGEMHKALGKYTQAIASFESYIKQVSDKGEKRKALREVAELQSRYGKQFEALAAFDRFISIAANADEVLWARGQMVDIHLKQNSESKARVLIAKNLSVKPVTQLGFKVQAKSKFQLGVLEAKGVRSIDPLKGNTILGTVKSMMTRYEKTKQLLIAPCEVPGSEFCSVGYFEAAHLAEEVVKKLLEVDSAGFLTPKEATNTRSYANKESARLSADSKSFATQAETALASGAPDTDTANKIRALARQHRGEDNLN